MTPRPAVILVLVALSGCAGQGPSPSSVPAAKAEALPSFASCEELSKTVAVASKGNRRFAMEDVVNAPAPMSGSADKAMNAPGSSDFSRTNVQVAGVDEADSVKTDGKYIYTLTASDLVVVRAVPASGMRTVARIPANENGRQIREFYVSEGRLTVLGSAPFEGAYDEQRGILPGERSSYPSYRSGSFVSVYVIENGVPRHERTVEVGGEYVTSRMIGGIAYGVFTEHAWYGYGRPMPMEGWKTDADEKAVPSAESLLPAFRDSARGEDYAAVAGCTDVRYLPARDGGAFLTVLALDTKDARKETVREVVYGSGATVYASERNLYVAQTQWAQAPGWGILRSNRPADERTSFYRFTLDGMKVAYAGAGSVRGTVLNQFSMDEHDGHFRVAMTSGASSGRTENAVHVLDASMRTVGSLTGLARGESIYSARFLGERAYLVTFRKVDPLFVLDLADPADPKVLGELKIPGYSDYLHPYDEDHIIGIGKDAVASRTGDFAWYTGVKMAVFDVRDVTRPKELHSIVVGDRGTDSPALRNHKAFFFDRERNLFILPITVAEVEGVAPLPEPLDPGGARAPMPMIAPPIWDDMPQYGRMVFQGSYVYNLTLKGGFDLKAKISHRDVPASEQSYDGGHDISRVLRIDETLYALSNALVTAHTYRTGVSEIGRVDLAAARRDEISPGGWVTE